MRSWMNTEESKRRILQKSDISAAIKTSQMYDFLIYIVPPHNYSSLDGTETSSHPVFLEPSRKGMNYNNF